MYMAIMIGDLWARDSPSRSHAFPKPSLSKSRCRLFFTVGQLSRLPIKSRVHNCQILVLSGVHSQKPLGEGRREYKRGVVWGRGYPRLIHGHVLV